jgi:hypothetical protein
MSTVSNNTTIEEVVRHLATMGIMDHEVQEAHHYAVGWLTATASSTSSRPEEPAAASDILNHLRQSPNDNPRDVPLMTEPCWWMPSASDISLRAPRQKRDHDFTAPRRGAAPIRPERTLAPGSSSYSIPQGYLEGLSESIYAGPSHMDIQMPAVVSIMATAPVTNPPQGNNSLEANPMGGWLDFPFPIKAFWAQKRQLKIQCWVASGIPPGGFGGAASGNRFRPVACPMQHKGEDRESECTDPVSESNDDNPITETRSHKTGLLEGNQLVEITVLGNHSVTPVSQPPSLLLDNNVVFLPAELFVPEHKWPISLSPTIEPMLLDSNIVHSLSKPDK